MVWIPKEGECQICGKKIILHSAVQKYCEDCRKIFKGKTSEKNRQIEIAKRIARKRGTDPDRYRGTETECTVKGSCYYGGGRFCEYMTITGRSRLLDGYPIEGGRCGAFKKGKHRGARVGLPETAPVLGPGKLGEI